MGVALLGGGGGGWGGGPAAPPAPPRSPHRRRMRRLAGARGGLLPLHPVVPPRPPRRRRKTRGSVPGCCPPPPPAGWGDRGSAAPPPVVRCNTPPGSPRLARLGVWRFAGLEASGPRAGEGRVPNTLGGAAHRRAAGRPEFGRAWDAGRAHPGQEDSAASPARWASGTSTWRPGATRGGAMGPPKPPEEPAWPSWPARQQRLIPQPRLLHRAHDGAPCSKQSAPCVPLPTPGGRLRCGAASGTLRAGARRGRRAYGS